VGPARVICFNSILAAEVDDIAISTCNHNRFFYFKITECATFLSNEAFRKQLLNLPTKLSIAEDINTVQQPQFVNTFLITYEE